MYAIRVVKQLFIDIKDFIIMYRILSLIYVGICACKLTSSK